VADLAPWLAEARQCGLPELHGVAQSLQQDLAAVAAALTSSYSNGQVEGQITRTKLIKRSMYGRGGFDLLRLRVLYRDTDETASP
jgi:transposase